MMDKGLLEILKEEVMPAMGCTGPAAAAYVAGVASNAVGGQPKSLRLIVDKDMFKGTMTVGVPGTSLKGLAISADLGAVVGDPSWKLDILKKVTPEDESSAKSLLANTKVEVTDGNDVALYLEAYVETDKGTGHAVVFKTHTNVVLIEANGKVIFEKAYSHDAEKSVDYSADAIRQYNIRDMIDFAENEPIEHLEIIREAVKLNEALAEAGFHEGIGAGFGKAFRKVEHKSVILKAKAMTAAAVDARMAGLNLSAMSCATSGNVGITASLPLVVLAREQRKTEEELIRSITVSFLITIAVKSRIGRLSRLCACALAAPLGVTVGAVCLMNGDYDAVERSVSNHIGALDGIICDGAKAGCAFRAASTIGVALESAFLALDGVGIPKGDGVVRFSADETIAGLEDLAKFGLAGVSDVVLNFAKDTSHRLDMLS